MSYHAEQVEDMTTKALELRSSIGIRDGYAHVFVPINAQPTPEIYVVLPGGTTMRVPEVGDELTVRRLADFIAAAINERLSSLPPRPLPHQWPGSYEARP